MNQRERALEFLRRFAEADIDGLEPLLAEDVRVTGPYLDVTSRAAYLAALRRDPPEPCGFDLLGVSDGGDTVAVFYDYRKRAGTLTVAQLFRFSGSTISEMRLVFDTRGEPAE